MNLQLNSCNQITMNYRRIQVQSIKLIKKTRIIAIFAFLGIFAFAGFGNPCSLFAEENGGVKNHVIQSGLSSFAEVNGSLKLEPEPDPCHEFGFSVSGNLDLDGDGISDFIVGAPYLDLIAELNIGRVYIFSGADGGLITYIDGESEYSLFGYSVACLPDVSGDGVNDFIIGAPGYEDNQGRAYVYSGETFSLLHTFDGEASGDKFGFSVSEAGDVNRNDTLDIIVGAPGTDLGTGKIYTYEGIIWDTIYTFQGEAIEDSLGYSVSYAGDVFVDNADEVIVGAPYHDEDGMTNNGKVYIISRFFMHEKANLISEKIGDSNNSLFGWSVSDVDIGSWGQVGILIGAPGYDNNRGKAYLYHCACPGGSCYFESIYDYFGEEIGDRFGYAVSNAGDVDGDTKSDMIIGAPDANDNQGKAYIYRCAEDTGWRTISGVDDCGEFGFSVAGVGDINGDDKDEVIIGARYVECISNQLPKGSGRAYVYDCEGCTEIYERGTDAPCIEYNILDIQCLHRTIP
jgi:hypothetical protein